MDISTILTVENEDLMVMDAEDAVIFFRELLWAEAVRVGVPIDKVNVSSWINVPDGGVDASITDSTPAMQTSFIKEGFVGYQIKTGSSFAPWQKSQIKKELFGGKPPTRQNLGSMVRDCLDRKGMYVLVCFGQDLVSPQRQDAIGHLRYYLAQCGFSAPQVDVWSLNNLISFLRPFPALALRANRRQQGRFETHQEWATHEDMRREFIAGYEQVDLVSRLQAELRHNEQPVHIRVWGEAGIGKTRLVLEASDTQDLRPLVVYCAANRFRDSDLMSEILRDKFSAILVLDECDPDTRAYVWNKLQYHSPRVKLVSIYNEHDDSADISYFSVSPLGDEQISEIIQSYGIARDQATRWARECSGSPRVAHVVGSNLFSHPEDILRPPGTVTIWERYIVGMDDPTSSDVGQRRIVLQHIALFKRFGYGRPVAAEARAIADMVQAADPQITWPRFQAIVRALRARRILQGENTLYITPKLLHVKLWIDWWETYGEGFSFEALEAMSPLLTNWFFEMFEYAAGSEAASKTVKAILGENGPFQQNEDLLRGGLGARFFRFLAKAEPASALECLNKTIGRWSREKTQQFTEGRREAVWALEDIARWRSLFVDAARLLLALGEAENETWSNNASGVFVELFSISQHPQLSPTEASPQERFPVLEEALNSDSKERRMLALRACDRALGPQLGGFVTEVHRVVGRAPVLWAPKTYGELFDAYRQIWQHLFGKLETLPEDERLEGADILLRHARGVSWYHDLSGMVIETVRELLERCHVSRKRVLEVVIQILHHDREHLAEETRLRWEDLRDELSGNDFSSLLQRYVGMNILEDHFDVEGKPTNRVELKIGELAEQASANRDLLQTELGWLVTTRAQNGYHFGYELGSRDQGHSLLSAIVAAQRNAGTMASLYFLGGYLRALSEREWDRCEELLSDFAQDQQAKVWVPELTWRIGKLSDRSALRMLELLKEGTGEIGHFRMFVYGGIIQELSETVFAKWIEFLQSRASVESINIALALYSHYYIPAQSKPRRRLPEDLTLGLLTSPVLFQRSELAKRDQMADYHWEMIGKAFVHLYPARSPELADTMLKHFGQNGTILGGLFSRPQSVLNDIVRQRPQEAWAQITRYLDPPLGAQAFHITHWLRGDDSERMDPEGTLFLVPAETVWQWVDENVEDRAWYLASFVPKMLFHDGTRTCWAREVLVRYGKREDVRRNLISNFSSGGWWGLDSLHYRDVKKMLLDFRELEADGDVKRWIDEYVSRLDQRIESAEIEEEREGI